MQGEQEDCKQGVEVEYMERVVEGYKQEGVGEEDHKLNYELQDQDEWLAYVHCCTPAHDYHHVHRSVHELEDEVQNEG